MSDAESALAVIMAMRRCAPDRRTRTKVTNLYNQVAAVEMARRSLGEKLEKAERSVRELTERIERMQDNERLDESARSMAAEKAYCDGYERGRRDGYSEAASARIECPMVRG